MYLLIITRPSSTTYISLPISPSRKITWLGPYFRSFERVVRKLISMVESFCSWNSLRLEARSTRYSPPGSRGEAGWLLAGLPVSEKNWVRLSLVCRSLDDRLFQKAQYRASLKRAWPSARFESATG